MGLVEGRVVRPGLVGLVLGVVEGVGVLPVEPCPIAVVATIKAIIAMLNPNPRNRAIGLLKVRLSNQLSKGYPNL